MVRRSANSGASPVGDVLRAQMPHTDVVTHTGVTEGDIPGCKVGDHVVDADFGHTRVRVTYEAKDRGSFTEPAARKELDEAADNRRAAVAVLVLSRPHKVLGKVPITKLGPGRWAVLYNDDVGSLPLEVVYQSARLEAAALADDAGDLDPAAVASLIDEATRALSDATNIRRSITKAEKAVDEVRSGVDAMVERVDDVLDRMRDLAA